MVASRTPIKDDDQILRGYLEEMPDGRKAALDLNCRYEMLQYLRMENKLRAVTF